MLGYTRDEPLHERSITQQALLCQEANLRTAQFLADELAPALRLELPLHVAVPFEIIPWKEDILIRYPKAFSLNAIQPEVRLEIGPMASWLPNASEKIYPYAAEHFPGAFKKTFTVIRTISAERTFWEKATILHQEAHRNSKKQVPPRYSRHYYDLYRMTQSSVAKRALERLDLLEKVVAFKQRFYRSPWASYETARPGSFCLLPSEYHREELQVDYRKMQAMLFGDIPTFEAIERGLADFEKRINAL